MIRERIKTLIPACAILLILGAGSAGNAAQGGAIQVKGSDTMVHLVSSWAEAYMDKNKEVDIAITGGGSGTGIAALINRTTDICAASRELKPEEKVQAKQRGVSPKEITVARDGLSIIVNPSNPIKELTMERIRRIYTGEVKNWKELGGQDLAILPYSRESSSGTYVFFQEHLLNKQNYSPSARLMTATSGIVQSVAADAGGIGYVGLGYAHEAGKSVKVVPVKKDESSPAVMPSEATVVSGEYSISRPLFLYTTDNPTPAVQAFTAFVLGAEGQKIVSEAGYVKVG